MCEKQGDEERTIMPESPCFSRAFLFSEFLRALCGQSFTNGMLPIILPDFAQNAEKTPFAVVDKRRFFYV